jgi:hypothetical protein
MALPANIKLRWNGMAEAKHSSLLSYNNKYGSEKYYRTGLRGLLKTSYVLCNLQMGPINESFCSWQAFPA